MTSIRFLLAPNAERYRLVRVGTETGWFWYRWVAYLVGAAAIGWQTLLTLRTLGMPPPGLDVLLQLLLFLLTCLGIWIIWTMPTDPQAPGSCAAKPRAGGAPAGLPGPVARLDFVPDGSHGVRLDLVDPGRGPGRELRSRELGLCRHAWAAGGGRGREAGPCGDRRTRHTGAGGGAHSGCAGACPANRLDQDEQPRHADDAHRAWPARGPGDPGDC
jgi:hypothetical protein